MDNDIIQEKSYVERSFKEFKSLESIYNNIHTKLGEFEDDEEDSFFSFINENKKYVELIDLGNQEQVVANRTDLFQDKFANENFVFMIGDNHIDVRDIEDNSNELQLRTPNCGSQIEGETIVDKGGCKRDRKGHIRAKTLWYQRDDGQCVGGFNIRLKGQRKRFCIWIDYSTALNYIGTPQMSIEYSPFFANGTPVTITTPPEVLSGDTSCSNCFRLRLKTVLDNAPLVGCDEDISPFITSTRIVGTTQGIGVATVSANCP